MALETLHPMVVHFPIALLIVVLLFDVTALFFPKVELARASLYLSGVATIGAIAAYFSGEAAEEPVEHLPGIETLLERHEDLGKLLAVAAVAALVVRLVFVWRRWHEAVAGRAMLAFFSAVLAVLVGATGYVGGQLVYEHGAGVRPVLEQHEAPRHRADP
ncbi:MAG: DUF2231 domain-containing protein [Candidatus Sericytochromatia bacterium]